MLNQELARSHRAEPDRANANTQTKKQPPPPPPPQDQDGREMGVAGSLERLAAKALSSQPVNSFDWSPDRLGLFVCSSFDQCVRVGVVTKLEKV